MSAKKRPGVIVRKGVKDETIKSVAATMAAAETAVTHEFEHRHVPLANIKLWDDQPRTFHLTLDDIYRGYIEKEDQFLDKKNDELEGIIGLAMSQKEFTILNVPLAYALPGQLVQLIAGQRRTMAAIFALLHIQTTMGSDQIQAHEVIINESPDLEVLKTERISVKVFTKKPDEATIERVGIMDNVQRTDLPVADKLRWLVKYADNEEGKGRTIEWRELVEVLALSRTQSYKWLRIVNNRKDPWVNAVIEMVLAEKTAFNRLKEIASAEEEDRESIYKEWFGKRTPADKKKRVSLGATENLSAIKSLIFANLSDQQKAEFEGFNWESPKDVKRAFSSFMKYWESAHG